MPSIDDNRQNWNDPSKWLAGGDEWSQAWGGTASLWRGTLLPRLGPFFPAEHLLEIACGHGRVTAQLLRHCGRYTGVDLAPSCVDICRRAFGDEPKARFAVTDGRSLPMVDAGSIDLAVSWDSLVHAEEDAMVGYVRELARVLRPGGIAWLHHSNRAALLVNGNDVPNPHWRASSVSAERIRGWATVAGLHCQAQEILQWGSPHDSDCISVLRRPQAGEAAPSPMLFRHPDFNAEIEHFRRLVGLYRRR
jgi:SAM-dependent methyltransferase